MPELPEVETVVRSISTLLINNKIESAWTSGLPLHMQKVVDADTLNRQLVGASVKQVRRRGKYILLDVDKGKTSSVVLIHLGMSGKLMIADSTEARRPHTHVVLGLKGDQELRFVDPRRFGQFKVAGAQSEFKEVAEMGPEPLDDLSLETFALSLGKSKAPIKAFLLDQRRIAGLGNIYVSEAMFEARVHPSKPALKVKRQAPALLEAVKLVLRRGIENRGTTLRDYVDGKGVAGNNKHALRVYGREGQACTKCESTIRRSVDAGRSTFYCPVCQKRA
jgi:formamidopyrimidine-DNA glycosylase